MQGCKDFHSNLKHSNFTSLMIKNKCYEQKNNLSDDRRSKWIYVRFNNVNTIAPLNREVYRPDGCTALLDAIGKSIYDIKTQFGHEIEENLATVVLIIITDGYENASRFYTYGDIQRMVKELEATEKWNFTFMGADLDAMSVSQNIGFSKDSYLSFSKENYADVNNTYFNAAARHYAESKKSGTRSSGFFSIFNKKDLR